MPRTPEQYQVIRQERKMQILASGLELFSREGYGHVSIASLAKHAGISKGLMYNYFQGKEELLRAIIEHGTEEITASFDPDHDGFLTTEEFKLFIRKTFQQIREHREYWTLFFGLLIQPNVKEILAQSALVDFIKAFFQIFIEYFQRRGFEDPRLELFHLAVLIEGMGVIMVYGDEMIEFGDDLFEKFEERIIKTYT